MRRALTSTLAVATAAVLASCTSSPPEPGVDVFAADPTSAMTEVTIDPTGFVEEAVTLDSCVLLAPGSVEVTGNIDLTITQVGDDGAAEAELVIDVLLGGTNVTGVLPGLIERSGSFSARVDLEALHGEAAVVVMEGYIGDPGELGARCRASLLTTGVAFQAAEPIELTVGPGVEPRSQG